MERRYMCERRKKEIFARKRWEKKPTKKKAYGLDVKAYQLHVSLYISPPLQGSMQGVYTYPRSFCFSTLSP
jgi:hypothetical protein